MNSPSIVLAPLRGVTIGAFRRAFAPAILEAGFSAAFAPFIPANPGMKPSNHLFADLEFSPVPLVPQLISRHPEAMRELIKGLKDRGFFRVDLNAGCPFPMIAKRGRGSGLFSTPDVLDRLLEAGCEELGDGNFSLKVRLGRKEPHELLALMPTINRYPLAVLTIHARTAAQMYEGECNKKAFKEAADASRNPVMYNGDVPFPPPEERPRPLMIGRSFIRSLGMRADIAGLLHAYIDVSRAELCGERPVIGRMKELLSYWKDLPQWRRRWPIIKICRSLEELEMAVR